MNWTRPPDGTGTETEDAVTKIGILRRRRDGQPIGARPPRTFRPAAPHTRLDERYTRYYQTPE